LKIPEPFADSELTTILVVDDLERSTGFYVNMLGAYLFREYGGDSVVLDFLGNWLLLVKPGGPTEDKPDIYFETNADKDHVSQAFTIRVKNCRQSYEILKRRGWSLLPHHMIVVRKQGVSFGIPMATSLKLANIEMNNSEYYDI
jgi:hypothetical protein